MTDPSGASSLFDTSPAVGRRPLLHPTNRYNLLEVLSSGLVAPRAAYDKYYADYLEVASGRIPIFAGALPPEGLDVVTAESQTSFPVALELDPEHLSAVAVPAFTPRGEAELSFTAHEAEAWAPAAVLPLTAVAAVHFRTVEELEEHRARTYPNVRDEVALRVTPEVFVSDTRPEIGAWLGGLPAIDVPTAEQFARADRVAGALTLLGQAVWPRRAVFDDVAELVAPTKQRKARPADQKAEGLPPWLLAAFGTSRSKRLTADAALYTAAWDVVSVYDPSQRWRPLEVVAEIHTQAEALASTAKDRATLERALDAIAAILRNDQEFRPFTADKGLTAARALLLFLLRPEPDRFLAWPSDQTGADEATVAAGAALSGLLVGRKRVDVDMRPRELDHLQGDRQIKQLNPPDALAALRDIAVTVVEKETLDGIEYALLVDGAPQITRTLRQSPLTRRLLAAELDPGTPDHDLALRICQELGWHDAVTTVLRVGAEGFAVTRRGAKEIEIQIAGFSPALLVLDTARFRNRMEREGLPEEMSFNTVDPTPDVPAET